MSSWGRGEGVSFASRPGSPSGEGKEGILLGMRCGRGRGAGGRRRRHTMQSRQCPRWPPRGCDIKAFRGRSSWLTTSLLPVSAPLPQSESALLHNIYISKCLVLSANKSLLVARRLRRGQADTGVLRCPRRVPLLLLTLTGQAQIAATKVTTARPRRRAELDRAAPGQQQMLSAAWSIWGGSVILKHWHSCEFPVISNLRIPAWSSPRPH